MWVIVANLVSMVLGVLFPNAPKWIGDALAKAIPAVIEAVRGLKDNGLSGAVKKTAALSSLREYLDEELDDLPGWKDMTEENRDKLIDSMIEVVWFVVKNEGKETAQPIARKAKFDLLKLFKKVGK